MVEDDDEDYGGGGGGGGGGGRRRIEGEDEEEDGGEQMRPVALNAPDTVDLPEGILKWPTDTEELNRPDLHNSVKKLCRDTPDKVNEIVSEMVRFILFQSARQREIDFDLVSKKAVRRRCNARALLPFVQKRLVHVFGFLLVDTYRPGPTSQKPKTRFVLVPVSSLHAPERVTLMHQQNEADMAMRGLISMVWAVLFMKNGTIGENEFWETFEKLDLGPRQKQHTLFGDAKGLVKSLIDNKIIRKVRPTNLEGAEAADESWAFTYGPRFYVESSPAEMYRYITTVMGKPLDEVTLKLVEQQAESELKVLTDRDERAAAIEEEKKQAIAQARKKSSGVHLSQVSRGVRKPKKSAAQQKKEAAAKKKAAASKKKKKKGKGKKKKKKGESSSEEDSSSSSESSSGDSDEDYSEE